MPLINHQIRLAARPVGNPKRSDWNFTEETVGEPGSGGVRIKILKAKTDNLTGHKLKEIRRALEK